MSTSGKRLVGWGAIELHAGMSRKTMLRYGYPVFKAGGTVWAMADEIDRHMLEISKGVQHEHITHQHMEKSNA